MTERLTDEERAALRDIAERNRAWLKSHPGRDDRSDRALGDALPRLLDECEALRARVDEAEADEYLARESVVGANERIRELEAKLARLRAAYAELQHSFGLAGRIAKDKLDALRASPSEAPLQLQTCPGCGGIFPLRGAHRCPTHSFSPASPSEEGPAPIPADVSDALRRMRSQMAFDLARSTFADREALATWVSHYPMGPFAPEEPAAYIPTAKDFHMVPAPSEEGPQRNGVACGNHWHGLSGEPVDGSTGCPWWALRGSSGSSTAR